MQGTIAARDGALQALRRDVNALASDLITKINAIHVTGYSLTGSTGQDLFSGTDASDIAVNSALAGNPALLQGSAVSGAVGDNQVALALAQLANAPQASLGNQTFSQRYSETVATFGQALSNVNSQLADQEIVQTMLWRQRDAVSGVSLDEEMTDMIKYQRAFEASARLISTVDELLETVISM
jgi:flagellar hook-associated protein 1 FlgK